MRITAAFQTLGLDLLGPEIVDLQRLAGFNRAKSGLLTGKGGKDIAIFLLTGILAILNERCHTLPDLTKIFLIAVRAAR
jgi:hypothetical protein